MVVVALPQGLSSLHPVKMISEMGSTFQQELTLIRTEQGRLSASISNVQTQVWEHQGQFNSSSKGVSAPLPPAAVQKLCIPKYIGVDDPLVWLHKCDQYFLSWSTPEDQKVWIASFYIDGVASEWYKCFKQNQGSAPPWQDFIDGINKRFSPPMPSAALVVADMLNKSLPDVLLADALPATSTAPTSFTSLEMQSAPTMSALPPMTSVTIATQEASEAMVAPAHVWTMAAAPAALPLPIALPTLPSVGGMEFPAPQAKAEIIAETASFAWLLLWSPLQQQRCESVCIVNQAGLPAVHLEHAKLAKRVELYTATYCYKPPWVVQILCGCQECYVAVLFKPWTFRICPAIIEEQHDFFLSGWLAHCVSSLG